MKESTITATTLPLVIESSEDLFELIQETRADLKEKLLEHGGLLFRGFDLNGAEDFARVIEALNLGGFVDYIGGDSPRNKITGPVYTSTEAPKDVMIPLHNELSFVNHYPKHIYFYCEVEPTAGGETTIGDAREMLRAMDPEVTTALKERGIKYQSHYNSKESKLNPSHKPWQKVLETNDPTEAEEKCRKAGFEYRWHKGWLEIVQQRPATLVHPETNEEVWFNQIHLYDFNPRLLGIWRHLAAKLYYARPHTRFHEVFYGDGEKIPRDHIYHILETLEANTLKFPWRKGDVMVLDNILAMHGRATFNCKRRILAAMTD